MGFAAIALVLPATSLIEAGADPAFWSLPGVVLRWGATCAPFLVGGALLGMGSFDRWDWTDTSIRWRGLFRKRQIAWADVERYGFVRVFGDFRFHYVRATSGERIWWSATVLDHHRINEAVRVARPHLYGLQPVPGMAKDPSFQ